MRWLATSVLVGTLLSGCASIETPEAATDDSPSSSAPGIVATGREPGPAGDCPMTTPGVLVAEAEAIVKFDVDRICPGYLTLAPGTEVRFLNESAATATVTVAPRGEPESGAVFLEELDAGDVAVFQVDSAGFYWYRISAIPGFVGTIEVPTG